MGIYKDLEAQSWEQDYFNQLTQIKKFSDIEYYSSKFQVLATREDNISVEHLFESYIGVLKEDINHELLLKHLKNLMEAM